MNTDALDKKLNKNATKVVII